MTTAFTIALSAGAAAAVLGGASAANACGCRHHHHYHHHRVSYRHWAHHGERWRMARASWGISPAYTYGWYVAQPAPVVIAGGWEPVWGGYWAGPRWGWRARFRDWDDRD